MATIWVQVRLVTALPDGPGWTAARDLPRLESTLGLTVWGPRLDSTVGRELPRLESTLGLTVLAAMLWVTQRNLPAAVGVQIGA